MPTSTPIKITLYGEGDEVKGEYSRSFVPWKILKVAARMLKSLNADEMTDADVDALTGLVVEVFGNQFSAQECEEGADIGEMIAVITAVVSRANGLMPGNPTIPGN